MLWYALGLLAVMILIVHFWTTSKYTDGMGRPQKEYRDFLKKAKTSSTGIAFIPPPPGGKRDEEVEALLKAGNYRAAEELLVMRMEEARVAPVGREARIARVSHYMSLLKQR